MNTMEKYRRYVNTHFLKKVQPIVVDRAEGAKLWDETGREFVDLFSGIAVVNAGHGRPEIIEAAAAQMRRLVHCNSYIYHNRPTADFAEALASIMPGGRDDPLRSVNCERLTRPEPSSSPLPAGRSSPGREARRRP